MNSDRIFKSLLLVLLFASPRLIGQEAMVQAGSQLSRDSLLNVARTIIDSAKCRVFITVDEAGKPSAREMSPFPPETDWTIWLGTNPNSRKAKQIRQNPNVIIYYYYAENMSYVSVAGTASLINDPEKKTKYWRDAWNRFYPDREKDYILIKVTPERLEVCSFGYKIFWNPDGSPQFVDFNSK